MHATWDISFGAARSGELGEDKRIKKDMIKQHIQFGQMAHQSDGFIQAKTASTMKQGMKKEELVLAYQNSNKAPTGHNMGLNEKDKYEKSTVSAQVMN